MNPYILLENKIYMIINKDHLKTSNGGLIFNLMKNGLGYLQLNHNLMIMSSEALEVNDIPDPLKNKYKS
jgi:hypothetical protein